MSFDWVDEKLFESDFFLTKLEETAYNFSAARYYFSAFTSAARSVTFALQKVMKRIPGFDEWYLKKKAQLEKDKLCKFFVNVRNEIQKEGSSPLNTFTSELDEDKNRSIKYYFIYWYGHSPDYIPDIDVVSACKKYILKLIELVYDCYQNFGIYIDPQQYYTVDGLKKLNLKIEDILERDLGFPANWFSDSDPSEILKQIRKQEPKPAIDPLFIKYLGRNRFGEKI